MKPAAQRLQEKLASTALAVPLVPVLNNIDVAVETDAERIRDALYRQAFGPVRWVQSVQAMKAMGVRTVVECGPGKVLAGMVKRIDPELASATLYDGSTLAEVQALLA
jgi:[acyl-carrier-protein] S-malonyltransferase